jgi:hypothetical protein
LEDTQGQVGLIEGVYYPSTPLVVEEREVVEGAPKKWILKGEFGRADRATENKRLYPRNLVAEELKRLQPLIEQRRVFGEADHPLDGRTSLNRISHVITKLDLQPDGVMYGEAEILNTARGQNLKAIVEAGCQVGVSSRGFGATRTNAQGESVVQPGFRLVTFDAVADPADRDAWPESFQENKGNLSMEIQDLTEEQLKEQHPELFEAISAQATREMQEQLAEKDALLAKLTEDAEKRVLQAEEAGREKGKDEAVKQVTEKVTQQIVDAKEQIAEQVRGDMLSDPKLAGAMKAVEQIKTVIRPYVLSEDEESVVAKLEDRIDKLEGQLATERSSFSKEKVQLEDQVNKLAAMAKKAGYRFYLEQQLQGSADADLIRSIVGDVASYGSVEEIATKVSAVQEELDRRAAEKKAQEDARQKEMNKVKSESDRRVQALETQMTQLKEALEKSVTLNKAQAIDAYIAERLRHHPRRAEMVSHFEENPPTNRAEVDQVLDQFRRPMSESDQVDAIRARVRALAGSNSVSHVEPAPQLPQSARTGGLDYDISNPNEPVMEAHASSDARSGASYNGTGLSLDEIKRLSAS